MSMDYEVIYEPQAIQDRREIITYIITAYHDFVNAGKVDAYIDAAIDDLQKYPKMYAVCLTSPMYEEGVRTFTVGKYRIFYHIDESNKIVKILKIASTAQNIATIKLH